MKKMILMSLMAAGILDAAAAQVPLFSDSFENGVPANSDGLYGFWTIENPTNTTVQETGGRLILTAGGVSSPAGTIATRMRSGAPEQPYNFFQSQLRFSFDLTLGGTITANQSYMRFVLTGSDTNNYLTEDAFSVRLQADNTITISRKQDRPAATAESVKTLITTNVGSVVTGLTLTIDAANYTVVATHTGGSGSTSITGAHGLVAAQWGVDGATAFQFESLRVPSAGAGAGLETVLTLDNISVVRVSSGSFIFEDTFGNGVPSDSNLIPGFWADQLPATSTAVENGKLVQSATSAASGNIRATAASPVSTNFNFFDNQFRISADVAVSGNNSAWLSREQLVLASVSTNGAASPDAFTVSLGQNYQASLYRKLNGPGISPDANNAAVTRLFDATPYGGGSFNRVEMTVNEKRYLLKTFNAGNASGLLRVTGEHGISRTDWGANGDSALLLETYRSGGAENTVTTGVWDNVQVEADTTKMLAEPSIDFQASYSSSGLHDYKIWLPSTEQVIRGVIFIGPGSDGDARYMVDDPVAQDAARAIGFALIGYQNAGNMQLWLNTPDTIKMSVQAVLDAAAAASGHPEVANAPLCITGLSAGAFDSSYLAKNWPERVISFVCHRGNDFSAPTLSAATKKVPGLMVGGSTDANSLTKPTQMKVYFNSWRSQGAQVAFAMDWLVGHTMNGNQGWEATFAWFVEVANLRYPRPLLPSTEAGAGAPALITLADNSGWLGDASTTGSLFTAIAPYASYAGTVSSASWMPNETCARLYRALTSTDKASRTVVPLQGSLRITSPAQYADPVIAGEPVSIELDPREFDNTNALVEVKFYDGATLLGVVTNAPDWKLQFTPIDAGVHTLTVVATDTLGNQRDALRTLAVIPADFLPFASGEDQTLTEDTSSAGEVTGFDPEGETVTYALLHSPTNGVLNFSGVTGAYDYRPSHGYRGADTFTFAPVCGGVTGSTVTVALMVNPAADANANGIPDTWETLHGITDPDADDDNDGFSNRREYLALTDPGQADDFPRIQSLVENSSGSYFVLQWPAKGGVRYRVQYSDDLIVWAEVPRSASEEIQPGAYGSSGTGTFEDDWTLTQPPVSNHRFYRIRIL